MSSYPATMGVMLLMSSLVGEAVVVAVAMMLCVALTGVKADPFPPTDSGKHYERLRKYENAGIVRMGSVCGCEYCGNRAVCGPLPDYPDELWIQVRRCVNACGCR